tara:strand:- start:342 stop:797 length:456 start_codon:yes stop_codon:yes gene_type:complete
MKRIDHVAITVDNVKESVDWYVQNHGCSTIYCDDTWAMLQFENIKLALVVDDEHPFHIAFEVKDPGIESTLHRDGSISRYIKDPSGNSIELIKYPKETKHFADGFHEGRWEEDMERDWPGLDEIIDNAVQDDWESVKTYTMSEYKKRYENE